MKDLIILAGAPGSGKSTIGEILREKEGFPLVEFGWLRQGHLDNIWSNTSPEEEQMARENLLFVLNNYWRHGYKNIVVTDLTEIQVTSLAETYKEKDYVITSLTISNDDELKKRVLGERDSGFRNVDAALTWNKALRDRPLLKHEYKIDNTHNDPRETAKAIANLARK